MNETFCENIVKAISSSSDIKVKSQIGTQSAWDGFSLQTLYIAQRILGDMDKNGIYQPETIEDLAIQLLDNEDNPTLELVQVKSLSTPLCLADLDPKNEDSFFWRVKRIQEQVNVIPRVVVFGSIGQELDGLQKRKDSHLSNVLKKFIGYGLGETYSNWLVENLIIEEVQEEDIENEVDGYIKAQIESKAAPSLVKSALMDLVAKCSRNRTPISKDSWILHLRKIGTQLASYAGWAAQYGKIVIPLVQYSSDSESIEQLEREYRQGASARFAHIRYGFDIERMEWIEKIATSFAETSVVILRGASGQGKSTLAYRFLNDYVPLENVFVIEEIPGMQDAADILNAVLGLEDSSQDSCYIYYDSPQDAKWVWLCQEIYRRSSGKTKFLVTVREDDYSRSGFDPSRLACKEISLGFHEEEAKKMFERYRTEDHLSFEDTWSSFGGGGPLLEYVYSLFNGIQLRTRLKGQIEAILMKEPMVADRWLQILRCISFAGRKGLAIDMPSLLLVVECPESMRMLMLFKDEHFITSFNDGKTVRTLHPYRAEVINELIKDVLPIQERRILLDTLVSTVGSPSLLIVEFFAHNDVAKDFVEEIGEVSACSWTCLAGVLGGLLWYDTRVAFVDSSDIRIKAEGVGRSASFLFLSTGGVSGYRENYDYESLLNIIRENDPDNYDEIKTLMKEAEGCRIAYEYTDCFLTIVKDTLAKLVMRSTLELSLAGYVLSWLAFRRIEVAEPEKIIDDAIGAFPIAESSIEAYLNFCVGCQMQHWSGYESICKNLLPLVLKKNKVVWFKESEDEVNALIAFDLDGRQFIDGRKFNDVVMDAISALRRLFVSKECYGAKMVGQLAFSQAEVPDCNKRIQAENLPFQWLCRPNSWFLNMCDFEEAPDSWSKVKEELIEVSAMIIKSITCLSKDVDRWYSKGILQQGLRQETIDVCAKTLVLLGKTSPGRPKTALDELAFLDFRSPIDTRSGGYEVGNAYGGREENPSTRPFRSIANCLTHMENFLRFLPALIHKRLEDGHDYEKNAPRLSVINFFSALECVKQAQAELLDNFGEDLGFTDELIRDMYSFAALWEHLFNTPIQRREAIAYNQRERAKRILRYPEALTKSLYSMEEIEEVRIAQKCMVEVRFQAKDAPESFEAILANELNGVVPIKDDGEICFEEYFLPQLISGFTVRTYFSDELLFRKKYSTLLILGKTEEEISNQAIPEQDENECEIAYQTEVASLRIISHVEALMLFAKYCTEVNGAIVEDERGEDFIIADQYQLWQEEVIAKIDECLRIIEGNTRVVSSEFFDALGGFLEAVEEIKMEFVSSANVDNLLRDLGECSAALRKIFGFEQG